MKKILFFIIFCSFNLKSQNTTYFDIEKHVDSIRENSFDKINVLTQRLIKPAQNDIQKVRIIFYWVAKNFRYTEEDYNDVFWKDYKDGRDVAQVSFNYKNGSCRGYASVMKVMLDEARIENELVRGHLKKLKSKADSVSINHLWNVVKINNQWLPIDVTQAITINHTKVYDFFCLTNPSDLIHSNYPEDKKWVLLKDSISIETYHKIPYHSLNYFDLGFGPYLPQIEKYRDKIVFKIQVPNNVSVGFILKDRKNYDEKYYNNPKIRKEGVVSIVEFPIIQKGIFLLEMIARGNTRVSFNIACTEFDNP
jgi:transglutaminase/protease-like cytokinesis protein 3